MPAFVKTEQDEKHWAHAKKIALRALHDKAPEDNDKDKELLTKGKSWGFVTDRYKKLKSGQIKMREESITEAFLNGYATLDYIMEDNRSRLMRMIDKLKTNVRQKYWKRAKEQSDDITDVLVDVGYEYQR